MKNFYFPLFLATLLCFIGVFEASAQKNLRVRITNYRNAVGTTSSLDCDGWLNNSDWEWQFNTTGNDPCYERDQNNFGSWAPNEDIWGPNYYYSRECWPTGNFRIQFRGTEDDGASNCDQECSMSWNTQDRAYRAWNSGTGWYNDWNDIGYATSCNCPATVSYYYTAQQYVAGSFSGTNLDGNSYVNNQSACTAYNLGSGTSLGATGNFVTQCRNTWYTYNLTSDRSDLTFNPSQNNGALYIYYSPSNNCSDICFRASSAGGSVTLRGAEAGRYYFYHAASGGGNSNYAISSGAASHDEIQHATTITPNYSATVNNGSYSEQSGEPNDPGGLYNTWWYTFVTPAGGYNSVTASISEGSGNNSTVAIYRYNGTNCSNDFGTNLTHLTSDRWCFDNGGSVTTYCLPGNTRYYVQYGTAENFAACIGGESTGSYNISINHGGASPSNNDICDALSLGGATLDPNESVNNTRPNLRCMNRQGSEPESDIKNTVWYYFTTPAAGLASVDVHLGEHADGADNPAVAAYRSSAGASCPSFGQLTNVGSDIPGLGTDANSDFTINCLQGNTRYYIQVGYNDRTLDDGEPGTFDLDIYANAYGTGPDNICDAGTYFNINSASGSYSINDQTNICAGTQGGEPGGGQQTVWYRFTTGATVARDFTINMDAETDGLNADVYVYEACSACAFGGLNELDNFYDVNPLPGEFDAGGTISGEIRPNSTYYIRADGVPTVGVEGGFDLDISWGGAFSAYDDLCNARDFGQLDPGDNFTHSGNNDNHTLENYCAVSEPGGQDNTVWYKFTTGANPPTTIYFDVDAGGVCTGWGRLYSGSPACPFSSGVNGFSALTYLEDIDVGVGDNYDCPPANTTFYFQVDITGVCTTGSYDMEISAPSAAKGADLCTNAVDLGTLNSGNTLSTGNYSNVCATGTGESVSCSWGVDAGVWFKFNSGTAGGYIDIDANNVGGDDIDIQVALFTGSCGSLVEVDCEFFPGEPVCATGLCDEDMNDLCIQPNTDYWVLIDGGGAVIGALERGIFNVNIIDNVEPGNDLACGAYGLAEPPASGSGAQIPAPPFNNNYTIQGRTVQNNTGATNCHEPDPNWTLSSNNHGVWYKTSAPGRTLIIDAENTGGDAIDIKLAIYQNAAGPDDCNLNTSSGSGNPDYVGRDYDPVIYDELFTDGFFGIDAVTCLDPTKDVYIMVDGAGDLINTDEGEFSLRTYHPYEGGTNFCDYNATTNWSGARFIGEVPNNGSMTIRNLSNFCGFSSMPLGVAAPAFSLQQGVLFKFRTPSADPIGFGSVKITATSDPVIGSALGFGSGDAVSLELAVYELNTGIGTGCAATAANFQLKKTTIGASALLDGFDEELIVNCLRPDRDYYLLVDGTEIVNTQGFFELRLEDYQIATPNDDQCNAIPFTNNITTLGQWNSCHNSVTVDLLNQNNYCGTYASEPSPAAWPASTGMVWYSFVAPPSGKLDIQLDVKPGTVAFVDDDYINGMLAVYDLPDTEDICSYSFTPADEIHSEYDVDVPPVSQGEDITVECLRPGRTYYLAVDGESIGAVGGDDWDRGEFSLKFISDPRDPPAPNDDICNATHLGTSVHGGTDLTTQARRLSAPYNTPPYSCMRAENNWCADASGDPDPSGAVPPFGGGFEADRTVWYTFVAPDYGGTGVGAVLIDADSDPGSLGDGIDLQIAVFENTRTDALCPTGADLVTANADYDALNWDEDIEVQCLNAGQTYYIMVDGADLPVLTDEEGYFELRIESIPVTETPPPNDDICDAQNMSGMWPVGSATVSNFNETNRCALIEGAVPDPSTFGRDHTVWYKFTTPAGGITHALEAQVVSAWPWPFGDAVDPQIALYESANATCTAGNMTGPITEFFSDYGTIALPFTETTEFFCLQPATEYYLMVDGSTLNSQGDFDLDLTAIAPRGPATSDDMCDAAIGQPGDLGQIATLTGSVSVTNQNNYCATLEAGEASTVTATLFNYDVDNTVWYSFMTPVSPGNNISIDFDLDSRAADEINLQVAVYQSSDGTCSGTMSLIDAGFDALFNDEDLNGICLQENTRYWVQVDGFNFGGFTVPTEDWRGFFDMTITANGVVAGPPNDNVCNATALAVGGTTLTLGSENNDCATVEPGEPNHSGVNVNRSVWYKFVAPASADVTINVDGNNCFWPIGGGIDPHITLFGTVGTSCNFADFYEVEYSYFAGNCTVLDEEITPLCLHPGETYFLQVDGSDLGLDGDFTLTIVDNQPGYTPPSNNLCTNAIDLTGSHLTGALSGTSCFHSAGARSFDTENYGDPTWTMDPSGSCGQNCGETWYKFTMPASGFVKIEGEDEYGSLGTNNSTLNIVAYDAGPAGNCGAMTQIDCGSGGAGQDIEYSVTADAGDVIFLQVFNEGGEDMGEDFGICLIEQCSADECTDLATSGPMVFDSLYCFNLETMTSEPLSESYTVGAANGDPTHSTYFQFNTDDFCDGYTMYVDIADIDLNNSDDCFFTVPYNKLTISVIEDPTPCDNNPLAKTVVYELDDCASGDFISREITLLLGNVIGTNIPNELYDGFKANTTYIIQIDVTGPEVTPGTLMIEKLCKGREHVVKTSGTVVTRDYCVNESTGWWDFYDDNGTDASTPGPYPGFPYYWQDDSLVLSIDPKGNSSNTVFEVTVNNGVGFTPHLNANYNAPGSGWVEYTAVMNSSWNIELIDDGNAGDADNDLDFPVDVRFYYRDADKQATIAAAQAIEASYSGATYPPVYQPFVWFKTCDGVDYTGASVDEVWAGPLGTTICYSSDNTQTGSTGLALLDAEDWNDDATNEFCNGVTYVEFTDVPGFSGGTGIAGAGRYGGSTVGSPLPVELISFIGWNEGAVNKLEWVTESEINNDRFDVMHSRDGVNFTKIGEVNGAGNSDVELTYNFVDESPNLGRNYYQLQQVDFDGLMDPSNIVVIDVGSVEGVTRLARLYPNPTNEILNIEFEVNAASKFELMVIDITGKIVASDIMDLDKNLHKIELDVSKYSNGNYLISISDIETGEQYQSKFMKDE